MTGLRFIPLAGYPTHGVIAKHGDRPAVARFLTPEQAKALRQTELAA